MRPYMLAVDVTDSRTGQPVTSSLTLAVFSAARGDSLVLDLPNGVPSTCKIPEGTNGLGGGPLLGRGTSCRIQGVAAGSDPGRGGGAL
jgi:hypothetical protein